MGEEVTDSDWGTLILTTSSQFFYCADAFPNISRSYKADVSCVPVARIVMMSVIVAVVVLLALVISPVYRKYRIGPTTLPCNTTEYQTIQWFRVVYDSEMTVKWV